MFRLSTIFTFIALAGSAFGQTRSEQLAFTSGKWVKIQFNGENVYKVSYEDLIEWGINPSEMQEDAFHFYTVQGDILSETNLDTSWGHAKETAVFFDDGGDGKLNPGDAILLYRKGSKGWKFENGSFSHYQNIYSNNEFGVIGFTGANTDVLEYNSIKMNTISFDPSAQTAIPQFKQLQFHEKDEVNPMKMGRIWLGERLGNLGLSKQFTFQLTHNPDSCKIKIRFAPSIQDDTGSIIVKVNNSIVEQISLRRVYSSDEIFYTFDKVYTIKNPGQDLKIDLTLNRPNTQSSLYLDYIEISSDDSPKIQNTSQHLYIKEMSPIISNSKIVIPLLGNQKDWTVFDVSDPYNPQYLLSNLANGYLEIPVEPNSIYTDLLIFRRNEIPSPKYFSNISNKLFLSEDWAAQNGQAVYIYGNQFKSVIQEIDIPGFAVDVNSLYEVFSGGQQDLMALRKFLQFVYLSSNKQFKTGATLIGAASYDYKNRIEGNTNFVPVYQGWAEQLTTSYCLDDVIGYLEINQGDPQKTVSSLTLPIGRIPARTDQDVITFFNKRKRYTSKETLGAWRRKLAFVSDDVDVSWESEFINESETYANYIQDNFSIFKVDKIYSDAYNQVTNGNNESYPEVTQSIVNAFEDGCLFMNYQGHGGEKGWAQESILDIPTINGLRNPNNLPILFTATCEFSRYDNPEFQSAGEKTLLNSNGGAIALMTTTRSVYVSGNSAINNAFWTQYGFPKEDEPIPTMGELFSRLKNRPRLNSEDNKFALLGDVSLKVAFPEHLVVIDSINSISEKIFADTLKAFSVIQIKGHINERLKGLYANFNGVLDVEIYDKPIVKFTLNNDNSAGAISYRNESSIIYKGNITIENGYFNLNFIIPKDINYEIGEGRALFYAHNEVTDAAGSWRFLIGGSENVDVVDSVGPNVKAFIQDTLFNSKYTVNSNAYFMATVDDESGINATGSGIGRDMEVVIDKGTEMELRYVANSYFTFDQNSYKSGVIHMPLSNLKPGKHIAYCKVWDIYNNSGYDQVEFVVAPKRTFIIGDVVAYPNPVKSNQDLNISFSHNLLEEDLNITINIYDISGRKLAEWSKIAFFANSKETISCPMNELFRGGYITSGIYLYRINVQTMDGLVSSGSGKFILN